MWHGFCRSDISVSAPFVWRCLTRARATAGDYGLRRGSAAQRGALDGSHRASVTCFQLPKSPSEYGPYRWVFSRLNRASSQSFVVRNDKSVTVVSLGSL